MFEKFVKQAELKWFKLLYRHCRQQFDGVFLPSHDHLHHARVWKNARSLLFLLNEAGIEIPRQLPEQLIISVFFHDVGLTRFSGPRHGLESRLICEDFFRNASGVQIPSADSMEVILHAIEHHDDKSLKETIKELKPGKNPEVLDLLSCSDDMDAFGYLGIYRYAEIYLLRGISPSVLPSKVSRNVKSRFENLAGSYSYFQDFTRLQEKRYRLVYDFYLRLAQSTAGGMEKPGWEPLLIDIFQDSLEHKRNLLERERILPDSCFKGEKSSRDHILNWFRMLDQEIQLPLEGQVT